MITRWIPLPIGKFKLNTDGASKGNPGIGGGGGLIRDHDGNVPIAFSHYYGPCYSLVAEAHAMLDGMRYAASKGIKIYSTESDSTLLVNIIKDEVKCPWRLLPFINELRSLIQSQQTSVVHIFRESNSAADGLANLACTSKVVSTIYSNSFSLPPFIQGVCRLDKL